ncbi:MAG: ankyrin repeat domain-containing protein [Candidatus Eremiobacteraeota bacterium]|nr:ankyrin repeat domain-containing protein [Candidatus Eremiobacteraeota bacterium]
MSKIITKNVISVIVFLAKVLGILFLLIVLPCAIQRISMIITNKKYTDCAVNCKRIGTALEEYARDHDGKYPEKIEILKGQYLEQIPSCPSAKKNTYSDSYKISSDNELFTFYCSGHHHKNIGIKPNYPQYNSSYGPKYSQNFVQNDPLESLKYAIRLKNLASINKIINKNPDMVEAKGGDGATVLSEAVRWNRKDVIELLISRGVDVNSATNSGWTPLHSALSDGRKDMAEFLISKGADVNGEVDGWTHLHRAVNRGDNDIVKFLLRCGANVNARNNDNLTPLYYAMKKGHKDIIKLLREHDAKQ